MDMPRVRASSWGKTTQSDPKGQGCPSQIIILDSNIRQRRLEALSSESQAAAGAEEEGLDPAGKKRKRKRRSPGGRGESIS